MSDRPVEHRTLHELLTGAEHLARELAEHLQQAFLPQVQQLRHMAGGIDEPAEETSAVSDTTIRQQVSQILKTDEFSQAQFQRLERYFQVIQKRTETIP